MPEFLAYKCDSCGATAPPIEEIGPRWHSKWCSACLTRYYDVFIGGDAQRPQPLSRASGDPDPGP